MRKFLAFIFVLAVVVPARAEIFVTNGVFFGTAAEWTTLGTPSIIVGFDTTNACMFKGDGVTAFTSLDCLPLAPSGADTMVITGTAGANGNCVEWNADGDIVDAGAACGVGGGASELSNLTDVGVSTPTNRNALMADGDSWESRAIVAADLPDLSSMYEPVDAAIVRTSDTDTTPMGFVIDEDSFASNLATKVPTQQSTRAYILGVTYTRAQLNAGQLDTRYYTETELDSRFAALGSAAALNAGTAVDDVVQLEDVGGGTPGLPAVDGSQLTGLPSGVSDHGALTGLSDDDHSQYHTNARGDARYYTQTALDTGQLDGRYYTETQINSTISALVAGDTGGTICSPATPTTTWTPSVSGCAVAPANITGPQSTTVNDPGAVGSGNVEKLLTVTASGGPVTLDLSAYTVGTESLSPILIVADGETRDFLIWTDDAGTTWNLVSDIDDYSALASVTPATGDLLEIQDVSANPDVHGSVTVDALTTYVSNNLSTNDTKVIGNSSIETTDVSVTAADHGVTIVCNHATGMVINVDDGTPDWSPNYRIYVTNIGAGDCTIQDGGTADVTIRTPTGFTAIVPQYGGATIIGKDVDEVIVTGGEAS
jgi:hypothetical protein